MSSATHVFQGRPLRDWLIDLVALDADTRCAAGEALTSMHFGLDVLDPEGESAALNPAAPELFGDAVREVAAAPDFPREEWVGKLLTYLREMRIDLERVYIEEFRKQGRSGECEGMTLDEMQDDLAMDIEHEAYSYAYDMALTIFQSLDQTLMANEAALREMLSWKDGALGALRAIARIGPEATSFIPDLMKRMDLPESAASSETARALATVACGDPEVTHALLDRLHAADPAIRLNATCALGFMGREINEQVPRVTEGLLKASADTDEQVRIEATWALGEAASPSDAVAERMMELTVDDSPWVQAMALTSLGRLGIRPEESVDCLLHAVEVFLEPSDDLDELERICIALAHFPPEIVAPRAMPILLPRLVDKRTDYVDIDVLRLITNLGPHAAAALPMLKYIQEGFDAEDALDIDEDWGDDDEWAEDKWSEGGLRLEVHTAIAAIAGEPV